MKEEKVYKDNFSANFTKQDKFIQFMKEREANSEWRKLKTKELNFLSVENGHMQYILDYFRKRGKEELLEDTIQNTGLLLKQEEELYPIRNCAIKTIFERARISGNALMKVSKEVLANMLNECMNVTNGISLLKFCEGKISAIHGGDPSEYAILEMPALFEITQLYLEKHFKDYLFLEASYDHSFVSAWWELPEDETLVRVYKKELEKMGLTVSDIKPALRLTTSDTGISGANLFPMLYINGGTKSIPLGGVLKLEHKRGATLEEFEKRLSMIYAQYTKAIEGLERLLAIELEYPVNTMIGVMKKIGIPKKTAFDVIEFFREHQGNNPCTAHDVYYAMTEVIFLMQCRKASGTKIAHMEEMIARALGVKWQEFDIAGEQKW